MKTSKRTFTAGIAILSLLCTVHLYSYAQHNAKPGHTIKSNPLTTTAELMVLITDQIINNNKLTAGEYLKGTWEEVKKSKQPTAMYWSYPTGVTLLGMQRVYDIVKEKKILDFVEENNRISADQYAYLRWQKNQFGTVYDAEGFEKLWRLEMLDDCGAMGAAILESKLRHNVELSANLKELADITGNFISNVQSRLEDNTFYRPDSPEGPTIWADDLYMSLPFLVRWSEYRKDPSALTNAAQQVINFAAYLQDKDGVWLHAYFVDKKEKSCCKWGRANGWVAVAIAEVLSVLPKSHPQYNQVFEIYKKQIDGLLKYQSASGLWHQVIDHPELSWGTETSCSAQFTYAISRGINKGWLDKSYIKIVELAFNGLSKQINKDGSINKVCMSTSIGKDLDYYNQRAFKDDDYHGNGLVLLALAEVNQLYRNQVRLTGSNKSGK